MKESLIEVNLNTDNKITTIEKKVEMLANLSKMLINADFRQQLLNAGSSKKVINIVKQFEQ